MPVSFLRASGWFGPEDASPLTIVGVGATGSHIALLAAKMGFHDFTIFDPDIVESHNLPNQAYDIEHIGMPKVEALKQVLQRFNPDIKVNTYNCYFDRSHKKLLAGSLILTVDTMSARKEALSTFEGNWKVQNVFETRLGFSHGELNIISNMDLVETQEWFSTLSNDEDIPEGPCNQRICTTLVNMIASYTVHCICAMRNSKRSNTQWSYSKKTVFDLSEKITTHSIG